MSLILLGLDWITNSSTYYICARSKSSTSSIETFWWTKFVVELLLFLQSVTVFLFFMFEDNLSLLEKRKNKALWKTKILSYNHTIETLITILERNLAAKKEDIKIEKQLSCCKNTCPKTEKRNFDFEISE
ncbi:hypothetical protein GLYMA_03G124500v4 [Glycine max]|nr:hypothetical protein GLYMA_03G124500v4 [Glycine max]